eukprot:COSAG06_NODE_212_length_20143_cov_16.516713_6_plen_100_part_00
MVSRGNAVQARAEAVNRACCSNGGACTNGIPTSCTAACAVVFPIFMADCRDPIRQSLGGDIDAYEQLNAQCDAIDPQPLMSALRSVPTLRYTTLLYATH